MFVEWALVILLTASVGVVYFQGIGGVKRAFSKGKALCTTSFIGGLGVVVLSFLPGLNRLTTDLFAAHQLQHVLLRYVGPLLIATSGPVKALIVGTPGEMRRSLWVPPWLPPITKRQTNRAFYGITVLIVFVAVLYVWALPFAQDAAVHHTWVLFTAHLSFLTTAILFWMWVFDRRSPPAGTGYGYRLMALWIIVLSNILIGSYTTLNGHILYPAYPQPFRAFGLPAPTDEQLGGLVIWVLSNWICLVTILLTIRSWGLYETHLDLKRTECTGSNSAAMLYPVTSAELVARAANKNKTMARNLAAFSLLVFMAAVLVVVLSPYLR